MDGIAADAEAHRLRPVDFRSPSKMARDHVRSLELTHEVFARRLGSLLTSALRAVVRVEPVSITQVVFEEYSRALPNPTVVAIVDMPPLPGTALVEVDTSMGLTMVDRMLGGIGQPIGIRRPTELEGSLLKELMQYAITSLIDTFEPLLRIEPALAGMEFNPHFVQTIPNAEMVMVMTYDLAITQGIPSSGLLTLCYPFSLLAPTHEHLETAALPDQPAALEAARGNSPLAATLPHAEIPLSVRLHPSQISATDLASLTPGDVIRLDHRVDEPVLGEVEGAPLIEGRVGRRGRNVALEVSAWRQA